MDELRWLLGLDDPDLGWPQMVTRALIIYVAGIALIRLGERRFAGKRSPFDLVLAFVLGSTLSRTINTDSSLFGTLAAGLTLVAIHWLASWIAIRWPRFDRVLKGPGRLLIRDGVLQDEGMRKAHVSTSDLRSALRQGAKVEDFEEVGLAQLEPSGDISVLPRQKEPRVVEIQVAEGVQTVRLEIR